MLTRIWVSFLAFFHEMLILQDQVFQGSTFPTLSNHFLIESSYDGALAAFLCLLPSDVILLLFALVSRMSLNVGVLSLQEFLKIVSIQLLIKSHSLLKMLFCKSITISNVWLRRSCPLFLSPYVMAGISQHLFQVA